MKTIGFVAQFPPPIHGLSKAVDTLYKALDKNKFSVISINISQNKYILKNIWRLLFCRVDLFYFTISQTKGGLWRDLIFLLIFFIRRKKFLIHLHGGNLRNIIDKQCGGLQKRLAYYLIGKADGCIVLGDSLKWIFEGIVSPKKIFVVPNCVDDEYSLSEKEFSQKAQIMCDSTKLHVLYLSNFIESKGYRRVLEVMRLLDEMGMSQRYFFHFAGAFFDDQERSFFFNFINSYKGGNVCYHGVVSGKKKRDLLFQTNVFVLLTNYPNEGQPISILEAMGTGQCVITTKHAGIPDIVSDNNGLLLDKNEIEHTRIIEYLQSICENRILLKNISECNFIDVKKKYKQCNYIENMTNIFNKCLEK